MPQISVIVPVYKVEQYIRRCVDSILAQTFPDFELILVDDGSPDLSGSICDEYAVKDSRVFVIHQKNGGLSAARNAGIEWTLENSNSQWLTFIDSDDWIHPQFLEILLNSALKTGAGLVAADYEIVRAEIKETFVNGYSVQTYQSREFLYEKSLLAVIACSKLYKKESFTDVRYPPGKLHEDEFTTYKILLSLDKLAYVPLCLYYYYYNETGLSKRPYSLKKLDAVEALKERFFYVRRFDDSVLSSFCLKSYVELAEESINRIKDASSIPSNERSKVCRRLKRDIRKMLICYGFRNGFWRNNIGLLIHVFPWTGYLYRIYRSIISK